VIVCLCRGISESDILRVMAQGAGTPDAITAACGAGGDCGACRILLADLVAESEAAAVGAGGRP
jgi:bacterioferritin-associated ferredoxin